jgi:hypothetical protein
MTELEIIKEGRLIAGNYPTYIYGYRTAGWGLAEYALMEISPLKRLGTYTSRQDAIDALKALKKQQP